MKLSPLLPLFLVGGSFALPLEQCPSVEGPVVYDRDALDGYTLLSDISEQQVILIDMEGNEVKRWETTAFPAKMMPGGRLLSGVGVNEEASASNFDTTEVAELDWEGQTLWRFAGFDDSGTGTLMARQQHDLQREGNPVGYYAPGHAFVPGGKTLVLAHQNYTVPEISPIEIQDDVIYEVDAHGNIGFEWHAADHVEEFGFSATMREGLAANPAINEDGIGDWLHSNSANYVGPNRWYDGGDERFHPGNILMESRNASFIAILDRNTGAVVWRVGPDYSEGSPAHHLAFQGFHHGHLIPEGLPGAGNILIYDNGAASHYGAEGWPATASRGYTRVVEFNPVTLEIVWEYGAPSGEEEFFGRYMGSAQRLPNGNTMISSMTNRVFEVTADKRVVWDYTLRDAGSLYRSYRVPPEWLPEGVNPAGYPAWGEMFE